MPWELSERNITRRPSVSAMGNGYSMYQKPDPNGAMESFKRANPTAQQGMYGAPQMGSAANDPRQPANLAQLREDAKLADQREAEKEAAADQQMHDEGRIITVPRMIKGLDSVWTPMLQALKNAGVDRLSTGGAARANQGGSNELGFYDTQRPSMAGLRTIGQQQRQTEVDNFMANQNGRRY
jgi:hypothetical protein